ncbi:hypothetical protein ACH4L5_34805 [Streptomyces sp. NPDC017405]|uniref:hypothetical protein n=1 Tax=unclassified Streptomyces TaxID=2593676 RepID=UPI0037A7C15A
MQIAEAHDDWARLGLAQEASATCRQVEMPETTALVLLVSDGICNQVSQETIEELCRTCGTDPQPLVDPLVAAARPDHDGYRDGPTTIVLRLRPPR